MDNSNSSLSTTSMTLFRGKRKKNSFISMRRKKSKGTSPPSSNILTDNSTSLLSSPPSTNLALESQTPASTLSFGPKGQRLTFRSQEKMRIAIEVYFERNYYDSYSPEHLNGPGGIVHQICQAFKYKSHATVRQVVLEVKKSLDDEVEFESKRKNYIVPKRWKIQQGSFEEHLVTLYKEHGNSYYNTTRSFNGVHRSHNQLPQVGVTAIYNAIQRTKHIIASTTSIPQTNEDNLFHRQARYNWLAQLSVRMGKKVPIPLCGEDSEFRKRLKDEWIDEDKLKSEGLTFVPEQVGYWDEIHIYQVVGSDKQQHLIFSRNNNGIYDKNRKMDIGAPKVSFLGYHVINLCLINIQTTHSSPVSEEIKIRKTSSILYGSLYYKKG